MTGKQRKQVQDTAIALERIINTMGNSEMTDGLVNSLQFMHRTLIQSFTSRVIIRYVQKMAENYKNNWYDGRDRAACEACSVMWNALVKEYHINEKDDCGRRCFNEMVYDRRRFA